VLGFESTCVECFESRAQTFQHYAAILIPHSSSYVYILSTRTTQTLTLRPTIYDISKLASVIVFILHPALSVSQLSFFMSHIANVLKAWFPAWHY
jgi:hypothetical protein